MNWKEFSELDKNPSLYTNDDFYSSLKEMIRNSKANEYYFCVYDCDGAANIAICSKEYFETFEYMYDNSMNLDHLLPDDFYESMESIWECGRSVNEVTEDLKNRGFLQNKNFDKFVEDNLKDYY